MNLIDIIKQQNNVFTYAPVEQKYILKAEKELNVTFSQEYSNYVAEFGVATFDGHEFTGLCDGKRLDVVRITKEQRALNGFVQNDWYVVECLDIDGIVLWQDADGIIYETAPNSKAKKIASSLAEYIASC